MYYVNILKKLTASQVLTWMTGQVSTTLWCRPSCRSEAARQVFLFYPKIKIEKERQYINEGPQYPTLHNKLSKLLQILHIDVELETNTWSGKISRGVDKDKAARVFWPGD